MVEESKSKKCRHGYKIGETETLPERTDDLLKFSSIIFVCFFEWVYQALAFYLRFFDCVSHDFFSEFRRNRCKKTVRSLSVYW